MTFHWDGKFVVDEIEENVGSAFVGCSDGKVVDLSFEESSVAVDNAGVRSRGKVRAR